MLEALNGWEENIVVTNDDVQRNSTTFLDLHLTLCEQRVRYKTYRKPKNSYMYLPRNSCHAPHIFDSIVHTELCRLRRTNDCREGFFKEVDFFCGKLMHRGYCRAKFEQIFKLYPFDGKFSGKASGNQAVAVASIIPLKVRYFPGLEHLKLGQILQHYKFMLDARVREKCNFVICNLSGQSLFLLRYQRFR